MRDLHRLNYVLVAKADAKKFMGAEDKSGMKGILVFYTKEMADDFIRQQGATGVIVPKQINGIDDLYRLAGPSGFKMYCVMDKEDGKYEGEFFSFADDKRLTEEAVAADPFAAGLAEWARKKYGPPSQGKATESPSDDPPRKKPWWKFW